MLLATFVVGNKGNLQSDIDHSLLETIDKNSSDRKAYEESIETSETELQKCSQNLNNLLASEPKLANTIVEEICACDLSEKPPCSKILEGAVEILRAFEKSILSESIIEPGLTKIFESERNRKKVEQAVWNAFGKAAKENLPEHVLQSKSKINLLNADYDKKVLDNLDFLTKFSSVIPGYLKKVTTFEENCFNELQQVKEQQNPSLLKTVKQKHEKLLASLLKELESGAVKLCDKMKLSCSSIEEERNQVHPLQESFDINISELRKQLNISDLVKQPKCDDTAADLVSQLRDILSATQIKLQDSRQLGNPSMSLLELDSFAVAKPLMRQNSADDKLEIELLKNVIDEELKNDEEEDKKRIENMQEEFFEELMDNPALTEDERSRLLDEFNEDMLALEKSLQLEREKHEEELRNRLAIQAIKRKQKLERSLKDETLENAMLEKQQQEMNDLEQSLIEEGNLEEEKIEQEYEEKLSLLEQNLLDEAMQNPLLDSLESTPPEMMDTLQSSFLDEVFIIALEIP